MRGLKLVGQAGGYIGTLSHPLRVRGLKRYIPPPQHSGAPVAPLAGAWIETEPVYKCGLYKAVAPLAGAWIETQIKRSIIVAGDVAPLAGAWIETFNRTKGGSQRTVAPLAGAWIETQIKRSIIVAGDVAPLAGAWIETCMAVPRSAALRSRTPCGCVD